MPPVSNCARAAGTRLGLPSDTRPAEARTPAPSERTPQGAHTRPRPARVSRKSASVRQVKSSQVKSSQVVAKATGLVAKATEFSVEKHWVGMPCGVSCRYATHCMPCARGGASTHIQQHTAQLHARTRVRRNARARRQRRARASPRERARAKRAAAAAEGRTSRKTTASCPQLQVVQLQTMLKKC